MENNDLRDHQIGEYAVTRILKLYWRWKYFLVFFPLLFSAAVVIVLILRFPPELQTHAILSINTAEEFSGKFFKNVEPIKSLILSKENIRTAWTLVPDSKSIVKEDIDILMQSIMLEEVPGNRNSSSMKTYALIFKHNNEQLKEMDKKRFLLALYESALKRVMLWVDENQKRRYMVLPDISGLDNYENVIELLLSYLAGEKRYLDDNRGGIVVENFDLWTTKIRDIERVINDFRQKNLPELKWQIKQFRYSENEFYARRNEYRNRLAELEDEIKGKQESLKSIKLSLAEIKGGKSSPPLSTVVSIENQYHMVMFTLSELLTKRVLLAERVNSLSMSARLESLQKNINKVYQQVRKINDKMKNLQSFYSKNKAAGSLVLVSNPEELWVEKINKKRLSFYIFFISIVFSFAFVFLIDQMREIVSD